MRYRDIKLIKKTNIAGIDIGPDYPPFVIAEISSNHRGNLDTMLRTITEAKRSGASAIKIQTYKAERLTIDCEHPSFYIEHGKWKGQTLYELYKKCETPYEWHPAIFDHCSKLGIICFSSPFSPEDVEFLDQFKMPAYKVASFEVNDQSLLKAIGKRQRPTIISCGLAGEVDIIAAMNAIGYACILLHCVSEYPAQTYQMNMWKVENLRKNRCNLVGLSDHSLSNVPAIVAVASGACVIEKHFTLCRDDDYSEDASFSLLPDEFNKLVQEVNTAWQSLQSHEVSQKNKKFMRSIYAYKDLKAGEKLTPYNIRSVRPSDGLSPYEYDSLIESYVANRDIPKGTPLQWNLVTSRKQ